MLPAATLATDCTHTAPICTIIVPNGFALSTGDREEILKQVADVLWLKKAHQPATPKDESLRCWDAGTQDFFRRGFPPAFFAGSAAGVAVAASDRASS